MSCTDGICNFCLKITASDEILEEQLNGYCDDDDDDDHDNANFRHTTET